MITKHTYSSPECDAGLFREVALLCVSTEVGVQLDDLVNDSDNIEWDV
ncbi:MAG: hypothetical protein J5737_01750 [Bacteroidales bacterium]|nr:hypothetical protein [Bacteroidales bacterium]